MSTIGSRRATWLAGAALVAIAAPAAAQETPVAGQTSSGDQAPSTAQATAAQGAAGADRSPTAADAASAEAGVASCEGRAVSRPDQFVQVTGGATDRAVGVIPGG